MKTDLTQLKLEGLATEDNLQGRLPNESEKKRGPYAVIECFEEIPCNPCVVSCRFNAIYPFENITTYRLLTFLNVQAALSAPESAPVWLFSLSTSRWRERRAQSCCRMNICLSLKKASR